MKRLLLDTITFDLLTTKPSSIPVAARLAITNANELLLCQVSLVELSNHVRTGQIQINQPFVSFFNTAITQLGIRLIDIQWDALQYMSTFDLQIIERFWIRHEGSRTVPGVKRELYKDPFDRLLIAYAITLGLPIVSPDTLFPHDESLGLQVIWK